MPKVNYFPQYKDEERIWLWDDYLLTKNELRQILSDKEWENYFNCQCKKCKYEREKTKNAKKL